MAAAPLRSTGALRQLLTERFPNARPLVERDAERQHERPVRSGIAGLDVALPNGGFPRGKLSVWTPEGGSAAMLRATCRAVEVGGERAAWVDTFRTRTFGWTLDERGDRTGAPERAPADGAPLIWHPSDRLHALRVAELLLRCGAFALVVIDDLEPRGTETVRLTRAARDGGGAIVALTAQTSMAALRITSKLLTHAARCRPGPFGEPALLERVRTEVRVRALGWNARAEFLFPVAAYDVRSAVAPGPDRRGGARPPSPRHRGA